MQAAPISDLVQDSKLNVTIINDNVTQHTIDVADEEGRQRKVRQVQRWKQVRSLGEGAFGEVRLEKLVRGEFKVGLRAVKMIRNRGQGSIDVDCHRELEAIAKF